MLTDHLNSESSYLSYIMRRHFSKLLNQLLAPQTLFVKSQCNYHNKQNKGYTKRGYGHVLSLSKKEMMEDKYMKIGDYEVFPWSISGIESSTVVKLTDEGDFRIAFDMGHCGREMVRAQYVFISHGHMDHISSVCHHAAKRSLYSMKPATYYVPKHLVEPLKIIAQQFSKMHWEESPVTTSVLENLDVQPISPGESVKLQRNRVVTPFPTHHRVTSQGYIVYHHKKKLKPEYQGLPSRDIQQLIKSGVEINEVTVIPEMAYTGDTSFKLFENLPTPDLLRVKLLMTESTYVCDDVDSKGQTSQEKARERGHMHMKDFIQNKELFADVSDIILMHFSDKYSIQYIRKRAQLLPPCLIKKVHLALIAAECTKMY